MHPFRHAAEQPIRNLADLEACCQSHVDQAHERYRQSARNLLNNVALRQNDSRTIQDDLTLLGLTRRALPDAALKPLVVQAKSAGFDTDKPIYVKHGRASADAPQK